MTLRSIAAESYDIPKQNVFGPGWMDADRFEIIAKISPEAARLPGGEREQALHLMEQRLLAGRFQL